ncbi:MAG TPA: PKD domain-containing protein, partial [bacterium]|nr:PKD domain-containing protein [bacterium]
STPEVILGDAGTYTGTVTASNAAGQSAPVNFSFTVTGDAEAAPQVLAVSPGGTVGIPGSAVTFSVTTSAPVTGHQWEFGTGATPASSTGATPTVTLGTPGTFVGRVIVSNGNGNSAPFNFSYTVGSTASGGTGIPVIIAAIPTGTVGNSGESVRFSVAATNDPTAWQWDFGGGATPGTSNQAFPSVTLGEPGAYITTVRASNGAGTSDPFQFAYTVSSPVGGGAPTITGVTPTGHLGNTGNRRTFSAAVTGEVISWGWNFGGGTNPAVSSGPTPDVELVSAGTFVGSVIARNANGYSAPFQFTYTITVPGADGRPVITQVFTSCSPFESGGSDCSLTPLGENIDNNTTWRWDFGQGAVPSIYTDHEPRPLWGPPGTYLGTVVATNLAGSSDPFPFTFAVVPPVPRPPRVTSITANGEPLFPTTRVLGDPGEQVTFRVTTNRPATSITWDFQGGATPSPITTPTLEVVVTLGPIGIYEIGAFATNEEGNGNPMSGSFIVGEGPEILEITPTGNVGPSSTPITFSVVADKPLTKWYWDFGPAAEPRLSEEQNPTVVFNTPGEYEGTVRVDNPSGLDTATFPIRVGDCPLQRHGIGVEGTFPQMGLLNGRLAIAFRNLATHETWFARALTASPVSAADWQSHVLPGAITGLTLGEFLGRPVVAYETAASIPTLLWANSATPSSAADWTTVEFGVVEDKRADSIIQHSNRLWLACGTEHGVVVLRSNGGTLVDPSSFTRVPIDESGGTTLWTRLVVSPSGRVAVAYLGQNAAKFGFSESDDSIGGLEWPVHVVDTSDGPVHAVLLNGRPAILYDSSTSPRLARALVDQPTRTIDWTTNAAALGFSNAPNVDFSVANQRLIIASQHPRFVPGDGTYAVLSIARALTDTPVLEADWLRQDIDLTPREGTGASVVELDGDLWVAYQIDTEEMGVVHLCPPD